MIKIRRTNLNILRDKHYTQLMNKISSKLPSSCKYTTEKILKANPKKLDEIAQWFNTLSNYKKKKYDYIKDIGYRNFSKKKKEYNAYDLAKSLNVKACVYCNRNYTFTVTKSKKEILRPDIDHYYDKESYPILALSFYNLIPSCTECNRTLKGTTHFNINDYLHPYEDDFNTYAKFNYIYKSKDEIEIDLRTDDSRTKKVIDAFQLDTIYNEGYQDIVLELIQKREIYSDSYINDLTNQYEGTLFKNKEDLLRLITCGYVDDKDLDKRPLSKLIKDISEELGLL